MPPPSRIDCRDVLALLPEYVAGRFVPDRERVAGHLSRCIPCDEARRDFEAVFALLAEAPETPETLYGEANTRLALQTEFGPGPLSADREDRRREDALFRLCAALSVSGMATFASAALYLWKSPGVGMRLAEGVERAIAPAMHAMSMGTLWPGAALLIVVGGTAGMLPALLQHRATAPRKRVRREV